jgi:hypothetical protein
MSYANLNGKFTIYKNKYAFYHIPSTPGYPTNGLIARWTFDSSNLVDSYGGHDLTASGTITYIAGKVNTGSYAVGTYAYNNDASTIGCINGFATFTTAYWAKSGDGNNSSMAHWACSNGNVWDNTVFQVCWWGGTLLICRTSGSCATPAQPATISNWHHYAIQYDASKNISVYLDGSFSTAYTNVNQIVGATSFRLFQRGNGQSNTYLDQFYLYNRAITASEISQLYNGGVGI